MTQPHAQGEQRQAETEGGGMVRPDTNPADGLQGADPTGWRPIETAPRDGTKIRIFTPDAHDYRTYVGRWGKPRGWQNYAFIGPGLDEMLPSHWLPLGAPLPEDAPPGPYPEHPEQALMSRLLSPPHLGRYVARLMIALKSMDRRYLPDCEAAAAAHGWHSTQHWRLVDEMQAFTSAAFALVEKWFPEEDGTEIISAVQAERYNRNPFRERDLLSVAYPPTDGAK